jgi:hypothetical protein
MINYDSFDWGNVTDDVFPFRHHLVDEIFNRKIYEAFFDVEEGDIVLDIGASIGPFTYSILDKKPKNIHCIEPVITEMLFNNTRSDSVKHHHFLIGDTDNETTKTFKTFLAENNIEKIDFLKTDCESGEYSIFNEENFEWISKNVGKISGEWHLWGDEGKDRFRKFRDLYLSRFQHEVYSVDGVNIKWNLWTEEFIQYYTEVIVYIDNR